jgi:hypothetical protein
MEQWIIEFIEMISWKRGIFSTQRESIQNEWENIYVKKIPIEKH